MSDITDPHPMMECGHAANGISSATLAPVCVICVGILPGAEIIAAAPPDLTGRTARCSYYGQRCQNEKPSSPALAFFSHLPKQEHDQYYCGCYGWD
jgi:hypothetical protein